MKTNSLILSIITASLLTGCGSSSEKSETISSGQFIDSVVTGLNYECSSGAGGITDLFGTVSCVEGDTVNFNINGFEIGSTLFIEKITPRTLFPNDIVISTNIAQLLQTLDSDNNVDNGITLDSNSFEVQALANADIALDQVDFDSAIKSYIGIPLVDEVTANTHLDLSIQNIENSSSGFTELTTVIVMNGMTTEFCATLQSSQDRSFEGFDDYEDFIAQGGSQSIEYFASEQSCDSYSSAGYCEVQDFSTIVGGTGSCVQAITFPFIPSEEEEPTTEPTDEEGITFSEFSLKYKPMMPNLRSDNIHFNGTNYNNINAQYQAINAELKVADTLYFIGGNPLYGYEVYTDSYTSTTLSTQFYDSQSNFLNNEGDWNIQIKNNIHTKIGEDKSTKFTEKLSTSALHKMYLEQGLDIDFDENDKAQFMITSDEQGFAYISLAMNESAYLKVVEAFMN